MQEKTIFCIAILFSSWFFAKSQDIPIKTQDEINQEYRESLRVIKNGVAIGIHYGHAQLMNYAIDDHDSSTIVKIDNYHKKIELTGEYYIRENFALQMSIGLLRIPKEENIDSISWTPGTGIRASGSGKGGAVIPLTVGIKKTFLSGIARPYILLLTGFTFIKIGSGTGSGDMYGTEKTYEEQSAIKYNLESGTGIQIRTGKVLRFDFGVNYCVSPRFSPSIGGIKYYSGWYAFGGLNFILNPNKL